MLKRGRQAGNKVDLNYSKNAIVICKMCSELRRVQKTRQPTTDDEGNQDQDQDEDEDQDQDQDVVDEDIDIDVSCDSRWK